MGFLLDLEIVIYLQQFVNRALFEKGYYQIRFGLNFPEISSSISYKLNALDPESSFQSKNHAHVFTFPPSEGHLSKNKADFLETWFGSKVFLIDTIQQRENLETSVCFHLKI
eukprot:Sdes_comp25337_c0_seq1m22745